MRPEAPEPAPAVEAELGRDDAPMAPRQDDEHEEHEEQEQQQQQHGDRAADRPPPTSRTDGGVALPSPADMCSH